MMTCERGMFGVHLVGCREGHLLFRLHSLCCKNRAGFHFIHFKYPRKRAALMLLLECCSMPPDRAKSQLLALKRLVVSWRVTCVTCVTGCTGMCSIVWMFLSVVPARNDWVWLLACFRCVGGKFRFEPTERTKRLICFVFLSLRWWI